MAKDTTRPKAIDLIVSNEIKKYLKNNSSIGKPAKRKRFTKGFLGVIAKLVKKWFG